MQSTAAYWTCRRWGNTGHVGERLEELHRSTNTEISDLRKIIRLRKSEVTVERISVCYDIEKMMEHGIHCLPCSYTNEIIDLLPLQLRHHINFKVTLSGCHSVKILTPTVGYSVVVMATDLCRSLTHDSRGAWHTVYVMLLLNYKWDAT